MNDAVDFSDVHERCRARRRALARRHRHPGAEAEQEAGDSNEGRLHVTSWPSGRSPDRTPYLSLDPSSNADRDVAVDGLWCLGHRLHPDGVVAAPLTSERRAAATATSEEPTRWPKMRAPSRWYPCDH